MSLSGTCPECGCRADLAVFASAGEVNRALAAALEIPAPLGGRVLRYLRLFSPPRKALATGKAVRLLTELSQAIGRAEIDRKGSVWSAPLPVWEAALDAILATPPERLPLNGHGYLFETVANLAAKHAGRAEAARLAHARGDTPIGRQAPSAHGARDPDPIQEIVNDLRALKTLEAYNPGQHTAEIAGLQQRLAAVRVNPNPETP
ncbi:hypothetical protein [Thiocystis violascens]|uniref:Uncharacterized protein n=1 Tax=Thiocystis violascens (strain ATCC 17096 / DSM 198 / 6111) TaxID=765911 RepID=I3YGT2_THIV6|nr:hypothetical protein [Thiocystis violascens]AFL76200.1 hypothetical protein Thivi_4397 [Thiocystis violascens DSM 198]